VEQPCWAKCTEFAEATLDPTHCVALDIAISFGNNEGFGKTAEQFPIETAAVILRKALEVDPHDPVQVFHSERSQSIALAQSRISFSSE
jgi:hypothetical protein